MGADLECLVDDANIFYKSYNFKKSNMYSKEGCVCELMVILHCQYSISKLISGG